METVAVECAREYYRALDEHDYDTLEGLLAEAFVHDRPDRTFEGRERFVGFMREERPNRDTTHRVEGVYRPPNSASDFGHQPTDEDGVTVADGTGTADVVVQGRLLDDGDVLFEFVDLFDVDGGRIARVDTYARSV